MRWCLEIPLVLSYYTIDTPYEQEAKRLQASCKRFEIECDIVGVPSLGSWEKNCAYKPQFLYEQMQRHQRPLLFCDADAYFLQPLFFEDFMIGDVALFHEEHRDPRFCVRSGTIFMHATDKSSAFLLRWLHHAQCIENTAHEILAFQDQVSLYFAVLQSKDIHIIDLPKRYCALFDEQIADVVIEHGQASRRLRNHFGIHDEF